MCSLCHISVGGGGGAVGEGKVAPGMKQDQPLVCYFLSVPLASLCLIPPPSSLLRSDSLSPHLGHNLMAQLGGATLGQSHRAPPLGAVRKLLWVLATLAGCLL